MKRNKGFVSALLVCVAMGGCCLFGHDQAAQTAADAAQIQKCQAMGRVAGSYKSYHDCMVDGGLHEGGSK